MLAMGTADTLIREWSADTSIAKNIAADLARQITSGTLSRWNDLPDNAYLAKRWDVSERTVCRAKKLLADHKFVEKAGGCYYVHY